MSFRLVPKWVTLNDLERRNGRYCVISLNFVNMRSNTTASIPVAELMHESIVFCSTCTMST